MPPCDRFLDPGERDHRVVVSGVELAEDVALHELAGQPVLLYALVSPLAADLPRGHCLVQGDVAGGPVLQALPAGVDVVEPALRVTRRAQRQREGLAAAGQGALDRVPRGRRDQLRLIEHDQDRARVRALDLRRVGRRGGEGEAVGQAEGLAHQLIGFRRPAVADDVPADQPGPLVDLGPEVVLELLPRAGGGDDLPVDPRCLAGQREPQDRYGPYATFAQAAGTPYRDPLLLVQKLQDLGLVVRQPLGALAVPLVLTAGHRVPVNAIPREARRIVQVLDNGLAGGFLPLRQRLRVQGQEPADLRVDVEGLQGLSRGLPRRDPGGSLSPRPRHPLAPRRSGRSPQPGCRGRRTSAAAPGG